MENDSSSISESAARCVSCTPCCSVVRPEDQDHANRFHIILEFKEIRKEWKQRKKEEETARKADEERGRGGMPLGPSGVQVDGSGDPVTPSAGHEFKSEGRPQLPPLGHGGIPASIPSMTSAYPPASGMEQIQHYPAYVQQGYPPGPFPNQGPPVYQSKPPSLDSSLP